MVSLTARYVVTVDAGVGAGLSIELPVEVLWAFSLNEGDLLLCDHTLCSLKLTSYTRTVETILVVITQPWFYLEKDVLRKPMEAVGPEGRVPLPERFVERLGLKPGDRLWLEASVNGGRRELSLRLWVG